ncbi:MAG: BBP7 family outer membrane beta-barrel protein [Pirellulaceae bacterium]
MQRLRLTLVVLCLLEAGLLVAQAADLRTSVGDRPVMRTVAFAPQPDMIVEEGLPDEGPMLDPFDGGCGGSCAAGCNSCCASSCGIWTDVDFLLGVRHGIRVPPLVTTSPNGTPAAQAGVLGLATTTVAYPTEAIGEEARPGGRIALGMWIDPWQCWGVEGRYYALADAHTRFDVQSAGDPILARPFFDVLLNAQSSLLVAFPGLVSPGSITITTDSQMMGGDALVRRSLCRWGGGRLDLLVGYQYARIDETLVIQDRLTDADPANLIPDGTVLSDTDRFATRNQYHAATIGAACRYEQGLWSLDLMGKIGLGNMRETVTISGESVTDNPPIGTPDNVVAAGLLASGVNLGTFTQDDFCVSPEINVKVIYHLAQNVDISLGYTFVYWSHLVQPGDQIDPSLRVPADRFVIRDTESWIHAFTVGAAFQF